MVNDAGDARDEAISVDLNTSVADQNTEEVIRLAEGLVGEDTLMSSSIDTAMDLSEILKSPKLTRLVVKQSDEEKVQQKKQQELKKWRKKHQAKVKEKYKKELENTHRPEPRPFTTKSTVTSAQVKKNLDDMKRRRQDIAAENEQKRIAKANNLLHSLVEQESKFLELERMINLTQPVTVRKNTKKSSVKSKPEIKPKVVQRGRSVIHTSPMRKHSFMPTGFKAVDYGYSRPVTSYTFQPSHVDMRSSEQEFEQPMEDESMLLLPLPQKMDERNEQRIREILYSSGPLAGFDDEIDLSRMSDMISGSELSAESYLDWDVVDEMVAMLSNRELSTPSTAP